MADQSHSIHQLFRSQGVWIYCSCIQQGKYFRSQAKAEAWIKGNHKDGHTVCREDNKNG